MAHRFCVQRDGTLLVVVFEGEISPEEEREALEESGNLAGLKPDASVLVERSSSTMTVSAPDVSQQHRLIKRRFKLETKPRMAVVVARDYDFGMIRMLELSALESLPHEFKVFRDLEEACGWLGYHKETIEWPKPLNN